MHHVGEQHVAGGLRAREDGVGAVTGVLQSAHRDHGEAAEGNPAGRHEGAQLHPERPIGPERASHQEPPYGAGPVIRATVAAFFGGSLE